MPSISPKGYSLIFLPERVQFHFDPAPERVSRERRALTTLIELPQAIYRESHGEGIQSVSLEGTTGQRLRLLAGTSAPLTGPEIFDLLEGLIENYWKRLGTTPNVQVEFHDHDKNRHHYAEIMSFAAPKGSENKMHDRYQIELRLYAKIEQKLAEIMPDKLSVARSALESFTGFLASVSAIGKTLSKVASKVLENLNRYVIQPIKFIAQAVSDFITGVTDIVLVPFRMMTRITNAIADVLTTVGAVVGDTITTFANTLRQLKRAIYRVSQFPDLFKATVGGAANDLIDAFRDLTEESSPFGVVQQSLRRSNQNYTGVRQATVRAGDTLQRIALRELGDASLWHNIALVNGFDSNTDLVANAKILIPVTATTPTSAIAGDVGDAKFNIAERLYGRDLRVIQTSRGKLSVVFEANNDLATVAGTVNLEQAIMLKTRIAQGTLLENKDYGLRPLIGKAQSPENDDLLIFGLRVAAESDPRIAQASVRVETTGNRTYYRYSLTPVGASQSSPVGAVVEGI